MDIRSITEREDEGSWYTVEADVRVKLRELKPKEKDKLSKQAEGRFGKLKASKLNELLLDATVVAWEGLEDDNGPLACTLQNKLLLDKEWGPFRKLWNEFFTGDLDRDAEDDEGNPTS